MVMLTIQSLGLSNAAPLHEVKNASATMDMHSDDTHMHSGSSDMPCCTDDVALTMEDCCSDQECGCCWGCSGLVSVPFELTSSLHGLDQPALSFSRQLVSTSLKNLYRPPISA